MRRLIILVLISALLVGLAAPAAYAGSSTATNVALGLASFAVFNQLVRPLLHPRPAYARPVYETTPPQTVIYTQQPQVVVVQPPPPPPAPTVVYYSHGRYELRANGTQYYWVWIPNPPPPPPPPSGYPGAPPGTP